MSFTSSSSCCFDSNSSYSNSQSELNAITKVHHCCVCDCEVQASLAEEHINGRRHRRNKRTSVLELSDSMHCSVCTVPLSGHSIELALIHFKGRKHQFNLVQEYSLDKLNRKDVSNIRNLHHCLICDVQVNFENELQHIQGKQHQSKRLHIMTQLVHQCKCFDCDCSIVDVLGAMSHVLGANHQSHLHMLSKQQSESESDAEYSEEAASATSDDSVSSNEPHQLRSTSSLVQVSCTVTNNELQANKWISKNVFRPCVTEVGLDTESFIYFTVGQRNELALIQIAASPYKVLLIQIHGQQELPSQLVNLLEHHAVTKFTVGNENALQQEYGVHLQGMCDLQQAVHGPKDSLRSTESLANEFVPTYGYQKNRQLQTSNWSRPILSQAQRDYAAKDAIIALLIGKEMKNRMSQH